jgi:hypothetical protein
LPRAAAAAVFRQQEMLDIDKQKNYDVKKNKRRV